MSKKLKITDPIEVLSPEFIEWLVRTEMAAIIDDEGSYFVTEKEVEAAKVIRDYYSVPGGASL